MELITSPNNSKIKQIRALRQRKAREASRLFLVEGIRQVGEAVQSGASLQGIFYAPDLLESEFALRLIDSQSKAGTPCYPTNKQVFNSLADKENPQGILAVVHQPGINLSDLNPKNFPWGIALVSPQDPGNLGAILRTIDAVGASGLLLLESSVDVYHPSAVRASMGTIFWHPVVSVSFSEFLQWARRYTYPIYGASAHAALEFSQVKSYEFPRVLLLGSEREGLTEEQRTACNLLVRIPMSGRATSLNLAVAAGILLYAMLSHG
jgi:TrmH family RNA methyltransferase